MALTVRFAKQPDDLAWCVTQDGWLSESQLRHKIGRFSWQTRRELVGLLRLDYLWSSLPHLAQLRVVEHRRREGAGRALVGFILQEARSKGMDKILSSTRPDKTEAQEWHRRVCCIEC